MISIAHYHTQVMKPPHRVLFFVIGLSLFAQPAFTAGGGDEARSAVARAIHSIRGIKLELLSSTEKDAVAERLNTVWDIVLDHREIAGPMVRQELMSERDDSFFIIDLSRLLLTLEEGKEAAMLEIVPPLTRCDPNAYGRGFFEITSYMAARRCKECLPAVLKLLEIDQLDAYIPAHALPVDNEVGIIFTIVPYGTDALEPVRQGFGSDKCSLRANSVMAFGLLLPETYPEAIRRMAMNDTCPRARHAAWEALDWVDDPGRGQLVSERLAIQPPPDAEERRAMIVGLSGGFSLSMRPLVEQLAADQDPNLTEMAKNVIEGLSESAQTMTARKSGNDGAHRPRASSVRRALKNAVKTGRLKKFDDASEMLATLDPDDLPLVMEARAAVLARLSDECLYEYRRLTYVAMGLRHLARWRAEAQLMREPPPAK